MSIFQHIRATNAASTSLCVFLHGLLPALANLRGHGLEKARCVACVLHCCRGSCVVGGARRCGARREWGARSGTAASTKGFPRRHVGTQDLGAGAEDGAELHTEESQTPGDNPADASSESVAEAAESQEIGIVDVITSELGQVHSSFVLTFLQTGKNKTKTCEQIEAVIAAERRKAQLLEQLREYLLQGGR
jgi:hypothetical protein